MVYLPSEYREIPPLDLLSWVFDNDSVDPEEDVRRTTLTHHKTGINLTNLTDPHRCCRP